MKSTQYFCKLSNISLFLPVVICLVFNLDTKLVEAYPSRREAVREYDICEKRKEILDKVTCMTVLRNGLEGNYYYYYETVDLSRQLEDYSNQKLKSMYQKERQLVEQYLASLSNE
ncbi:hypothetical protein [Hyella patelloides]|uniref:hypothetical protein n=1 Tax=Hyella patelloides TaxID=1982969 RepID=UPI0011A7B4B6|nr:hypothetical protein [Hyella patelloides]